MGKQTRLKIPSSRYWLGGTVLVVKNPRPSMQGVQLASRGGTVVKNPVANAGDARVKIRSLGRKYPLEKKVATHSSILVLKIPRTEEPGGRVHGITKSQAQLNRSP